MSTPPSESPRLPDAEKDAAGDEPDLERPQSESGTTRIPDDEKDDRIPDPEE